MDRNEIDKVLQSRRMSQGKACYPCRQRKVRCNHELPCHTCRRRGHPEICNYSLSTSPKTGNSGTGTDTRTLSRSSPQARGSGRGKRTVPATSLESAPNCPTNTSKTSSRTSFDNTPPLDHNYEGDSSIVTILRQHADDESLPELIQETRVSFGLQNTLLNDPSVKVSNQQQRWSNLLNIAPRDYEVQRFVNSYRYTVYPFAPFILDIDRFDSCVSRYLECWAAGEFCNTSKISEQWVSDEGVTTIALLLSTLACGSHFSALESEQRSKISLDFIRRTFEGLRLANFMFCPSPDVIQTLLVLGNALQNLGQSDGSWVLLGTTVRLAQALGLHAGRSVNGTSVSSRNGKALWTLVAWQDCFLSVCHGRPPSVWKAHIPDTDTIGSGNLSYIDAMTCVALACLQATGGTQDMEQSVGLVKTIDGYWSHTLPYLQNRAECHTLQEHLEHLALRINTAFAVSFLCRPVIRKSVPESRSTVHQFLAARAKKSLMCALSAFLSFQALSFVPLRTWSMVHSTLTSLLLLCVWEDTRDDPTCCDLQSRVVDALAAYGKREFSVNGNREPNPSTQLLSSKNIQSLVALRVALRKRPSAAQTVTGTMPASEALASTSTALWQTQATPSLSSRQLSPNVDESDDTFSWAISELSQTAFMDELLGVDLFLRL